MRKRWTQAILCLAIVGLFFGWIRHVDAQTEQDAQLLINVVKPFMQSDPKVTFKFTSYFGKCESENSKIIAAGESLSRELGFTYSNNEALPSQQGIYSVKSEVEPGAIMTLTVASPAGQSSCYTVLRLDASGSVAQKHLLKWQEQVTTRLNKQIIKGIWNVMIQGNASSDALSDNPKEFLAELAQVHIKESLLKATKMTPHIAFRFPHRRSRDLL